MYVSDSPLFVWKVFQQDYACLATFTILVLLTTLIIQALWFKKRSVAPDKLLPPGPRGVPFLGFLPFLGSSPHITYKRLSETQGPVLRVKLGSTNVVVLNDLDSIKEGLNNSEVLARPADFLFRRVGVDGIASISGQAWVENRRFCMQVLRDLGFGRKSMEEHIKEEIAELCDVLKSWNSRPAPTADVIMSSVSNNITALVFGERYGHDDPRRQFLNPQLKMIARNASFAAAGDFLPAVWKLLSYSSLSKSRLFRQYMDGLVHFIRKEVNEHSKTLSANVNRDFIDVYLKKISENKGRNSSFNLHTLIGNVQNLFGAGSNTVSTSIEWILLLCARDPKGVQRRLQQEVDNVLGRERAPGWEDRHRMPYTMAVIWETLRWRTITPLGLIREAERDTSIGSFHVPAHTAVIFNFWAIHHDPEIWRHPFDFDPTRFLNADRTRLLPKPAALMPFTAGRRMCPAETLAMMEIFMYLSTLMQTFTVLPKEGETISLEIHQGISTIPLHTQELRFLPR
ncbi:cytochrome P450 2J4-like [Ixodes scapularis]|uniref:cytochrome P450 2J4-like n=1 Tax=Ixodes scapularis TaxID=6945 RepID=UPI001C38977A|nr:cytochrome P450 2J4-like [Ixodes scapularis]